MSFTIDEAKRIRESLISCGKRVFSEFGLKRSRVEDMARECGIAKGSFYRFFASKEELCMAILEEEEQVRDREMARTASGVNSATDIEYILKNACRAFRDSPVAMRLYELDEFPQLVRKLSPERIAVHQQGDKERMESLISAWKKQGAFPDHDPGLVAGLFRALLVLSFQQKSIGIENFDEVMDLMIRSVARGLTN